MIVTVVISYFCEFCVFCGFYNHRISRTSRMIRAISVICCFLFLARKITMFFLPRADMPNLPAPTMSLLSSSFPLSLWYQIQDNNNTKHNTQHEQFILHYESHCRSARLAVGSHRAINQFHRRMLLCPHHRLLYGMAVQPSHL